MRRWLRWAASVFRSRRAFDRDLRDEFAFHLDTRASALEREGLAPDAAQRQARLDFGARSAYEDRSREAIGTQMIDDCLRDLQFGWRMMRRRPGGAIVIVLTLALGIGANTAVFSLVDAIFLRPLPVTDPDRLVLFSGDTSQGTVTGSPPPDGVWSLFSNDAYDFLRGEDVPLQSIAAFQSGRDTVTVHLPRRPSDVSADTGVRAGTHLVSGNYFDVLGVTAVLGRTLRSGDDRPEAAPVVVISDACWRERFGAEPSAVGRSVTINETPFVVVGVMPASFFGERTDRHAPDFWIPLAHQPQVQLREAVAARSDYYWLSLVGRLQPGQARAGAQAAVTASLRRFLIGAAGASPDEAARRRIQSVRVEMTSGARGISRDRETSEHPLALLVAAVGLVLLIACANVATLLLCRGAARRPEVAVRRALGAGHVRLLRQWLTESLTLALTGAVGGVMVAYWATPALLSYFPTGPNRPHLNGTVLAYAATLTLLAGLIFGLAPALQASRVDALAALRSTGRGSRQRFRAWGATESFVIVQIAVSLVLVVGATLFARTLFNLEHEPLGFAQEDVLLVQINPRLAGYTPATVTTLYRRLHAQVTALPGVEAATFARYSPFGGHSSSFGATVDGYTPPPGERLSLEAVEVGPDYPQTLGMPLVMGRAIGSEDTAGATRVAMVNEAFVRQFFPSSSPLGHHVSLNQEYEIVGVVRDALFHRARDQAIPFVFTPLLQQANQMMLECEIAVRTHGDSGALASAVRQVVTSTDSRVSVVRARTLQEQVRATFGPERVATGFVALFAALALLLAAMGLYGVVSHSVAQRTQEIGVRLALGAAPADIVWLVLRQTVAWLVVGTAIGAGASVLAGRAVEHQLFGVSASDLTSLVVATAALGLVALAASLIPARRALRIQPTMALKTE